jgi:hypothetical protein
LKMLDVLACRKILQNCLLFVIASNKKRHRRFRRFQGSAPIASVPRTTEVLTL